MPAAVTGPPPPHRPLWRTLLAGAAVISFAAFGAVILYLVTVPLLWWRDDYCQGSSSGHEDKLCIVLPDVEIEARAVHAAMRRVTLGAHVLALALTMPVTANSETPEEWIAFGTRIHGGFGAFIPLGIKIGLDAVQHLNAKPRS